MALGRELWAQKVAKRPDAYVMPTETAASPDHRQNGKMGGTANGTANGSTTNGYAVHANGTLPKNGKKH